VAFVSLGWTKSESNSWGDSYNTGHHFLGFCYRSNNIMIPFTCKYRGELDNLKKLASQLDPPALKSMLNSVNLYRTWEYHGNYSSPLAAGIGWDQTGSFFRPLVGDRSRMAKKLPVEQWGAPLHWACMSGRFEVVQFLCSLPVDLQIKIKAYNATPADVALRNGHWKIYKFLKSQKK